MKPTPLTDADLDEIEDLARTDAAEAYRGPLLALVAEVRRLRGIVLEGAQPGAKVEDRHSLGELRVGASPLLMGPPGSRANCGRRPLESERARRCPAAAF